MTILSCIQPATAHVVSVPAPFATTDTEPHLQRGIRLEYVAEPSDAALLARARDVVRLRLGAMRPVTEHAVRLEHDKLVIELGPTSAEQLERAKALATVSSGLRVAPSRDDDDPLHALDRLDAPRDPDVWVNHESVGPGSVVSHVTYASTLASPSRSEATRRLLGFIRRAAPDVSRVVVGSATDPEGREAVRTWVLASEPLELGVAQAARREDQVEVELTGASASAFADLTRRSLNRRVVVFVGDDVAMVPVVVGVVEGGRLVLSRPPEAAPGEISIEERLLLPALPTRLGLASEVLFGEGR
jgi:hypothetical protein